MRPSALVTFEGDKLSNGRIGYIPQPYNINRYTPPGVQSVHKEKSWVNAV